MTESTKLHYRVRPGCVHGALNEYGPGAVVELTEVEAAGFLDKLELVMAPAVADEPTPVEPAPRRRPKSEA